MWNFTSTFPYVFMTRSLGTILPLDEISGLRAVKNKVVIFSIIASCSFGGTCRLKLQVVVDMDKTDIPEMVMSTKYPGNHKLYLPLHLGFFRMSQSILYRIFQRKNLFSDHIKVADLKNIGLCK
jgi:hypothetical protein